jgi:hypothetical protein
MTNRQAVTILKAIHTLATAYPIGDRDEVDARYAIALGQITGAALEGLNAVKEDRNIRLVRFDEKRR